MLRRGFQPSRLGVALVAMISLASGVWILLFANLSLMIFRQSTMGRTVCDRTVYSNGAYRLMISDGDLLVMPINSKFLKKYYP